MGTLLAWAITLALVGLVLYLLPWWMAFVVPFVVFGVGRLARQR